MRRLCFTLAGVLVLSAVTWAAPFDRGPYAGAPSLDSIVVRWAGDPQFGGRVDVGLRSVYEEDGTFSRSVDVPARDPESTGPVHVVVDGLAPGTDYVYQVRLDDGTGEIASPLGRFCTEPAPGSPVSFAVLSDTQWQWEGANRLRMVADAIVASPAAFDFILHAGDLVESPATPYWDHWFDSFSDMLLVAPFLPVLGNHERSSRTYYDNFVFPPGAGRDDEQWWALHWGDVVVVGLDSTAGRADRIMAQQAWAAEQLSGPELHKFVIFHYPVFSSDAFHGSGYSYDVIYHPIFLEHGVDIVFNGHAHNYERIVYEGITYLVVGGGGAVPRALAETRVDGSVVAIEGYNFYLEVTTSPEGIAVDVPSIAIADDNTVVATRGELLDSFFLPIAGIDEEVPAESSATEPSGNVVAMACIAAIVFWAIFRVFGR